MIITQTQRATGDNTAPECAAPSLLSEPHHTHSSVESFGLPAQLHLHNQIISHHPRAGLNPVADAAGYLFTVMGQLKEAQNFRQLGRLQKELLQEINTFQKTIKNHGYHQEYILVCRYIICAAIDELISNTEWGGEHHWDQYSLLAAFGQDVHHQEKFFGIMERAIKEPAYYIDLMELMYICLSMGYRGRYRGNDIYQAQLEQVTSALYKHIRAYRGNFSKVLSPAPLKPPRPASKHSPHAPTSHLTVFLLTACIIMTLFISLGYLMEMISNEAFSNFTDIQKPVSRNNIQQ
jgi:type VI secretion system protein ImpK